MKKYLTGYIVLLFVFPNSLNAEVNPASSDRALIQQILKERKEKFSTYTESLDDATGWFGIKTKKDLKKSQSVLVEIVRLDNRLINVLNRREEFYKFENVTKTYEQHSDSEKLTSLEHEIELTGKKIILLNQQIVQLDEQNQIKNIFLLLLSIISGYLMFLLWKRKNAAEKN
jgi:hypothetical protein